LPAASAALSGRVGKVVSYPPLSEVSADQRRGLHEALLDADCFEDLPGNGRRQSSKPKRHVGSFASSLGD
jgi:hypothetical protein